VADTQTFKDIDGDKWQRIVASVKTNAGIELGGNTGEASEHGVTLSWNYDPNASTLEVTLVGRAWYDPSEATIDARLKAWIESA
jgi:hypothetical protein